MPLGGNTKDNTLSRSEMFQELYYAPTQCARNSPMPQCNVPGIPPFLNAISAKSSSVPMQCARIPSISQRNLAKALQCSNVNVQNPLYPYKMPRRFCFIKQFVVTNCKQAAPWLNSNRNSKKRNFDSNGYINRIGVYADFKYIGFFEFNRTNQRLQAYKNSPDFFLRGNTP